MKTAYHFLKELSENNNRQWFHEHKKFYQQAREEFENIVKELIYRISEFDQRIFNITPQESIFRINRDMRFARDKSPYKINLSAHIAPYGRRSRYAGYYLHLQPGGSFLGGGIYCPEKDALDAVRTEIYDNPQKFIPILENRDFRQTFGALEGRKLKKTPRGFDHSFEYVDLLKYKDYVVSTPIQDEVILSDSFLEKAVEIFRILYPFNEFINKAVDKLLL